MVLKKIKKGKSLRPELNPMTKRPRAPAKEKKDVKSFRENVNEMAKRLGVPTMEERGPGGQRLVEDILTGRKPGATNVSIDLTVQNYINRPGTKFHGLTAKFGGSNADLHIKTESGEYLRVEGRLAHKEGTGAQAKYTLTVGGREFNVNRSELEKSAFATIEMPMLKEIDHKYTQGELNENRTTTEELNDGRVVEITSHFGGGRYSAIDHENSLIGEIENGIFVPTGFHFPAKKK